MATRLCLPPSFHPDVVEYLFLEYFLLHALYRQPALKYYKCSVAKKDEKINAAGPEDELHP